MNIIIYNGNLKPPYFINLLANKLSEKGHAVFLAGTARKLRKYKIDKLILVPTDSNSIFLLFIQLLITSIRLIILRPLVFLKLIKIALKSKKRLKLIVKQYLIWANLVLLKSDIVHIQWASHISLFEEIIDKQFFKIVVSFRGRLVNISPYVDDDLKELYVHNFPKVDGIHGVSNAILNNLIKLDIKVKKAKVIYSGIDLKCIPHKSDFEIKGTINLLSIGRYHWKKGYNIALAACSILKQNEIKFLYSIIADGIVPEELLFQRQQLGLEKEVIFENALTHYEVLEKMKESDVLLLPSVEEGIANVVLEAMAVGLPVISSDCGGMNELIIDGENGWLFENRNPKELAFKIQLFLKTNEKDMINMTTKASQTIKTKHSLDKMCVEMINFYHEL